MQLPSQQGCNKVERKNHSQNVIHIEETGASVALSYIGTFR